MRKYILPILLSLFICFPAYGADKKISELTALAAEPASDDALVVYDSSAGSTKKVNYTYFKDIKNVNLYGGLTAAVASIGATETTLLITDAQTVTNDLSIPTTMQLFIAHGGDIAVSAGKVLTVNGTILAGGYQIFSGSGTVTFSGNGIEYGVWKSGGSNTVLVDSNDIGVGGTPGLVIRPKFTWKDADEIYIQPFVYHHQGTSEQLVYSDSSILYEFQNLGTSDWSYLYLDDSAIVTAGTNLIATLQFTDSTTESVWSNAKHGEYNGLDRCIVAVLTDGSNNILAFFHNGNLFYLEQSIEDLSSTDIDTTPYDVTLTAPKFAREVLVTLRAAFVTNAVNSSWRTNGASAGHIVGSVDTNTRQDFSTFPVITDGSQIIEVWLDAAGDDVMQLWTLGYFFPIGM